MGHPLVIIVILACIYLLIGTVLIFYLINATNSVRKRWIKEGHIRYSDNDFPGLVIDDKGEVHVDHVPKYTIAVIVLILFWPLVIATGLKGFKEIHRR